MQEENNKLTKKEWTQGIFGVIIVASLVLLGLYFTFIVFSFLFGETVGITIVSLLSIGGIINMISMWKN